MHQGVFSNEENFLKPFSPTLCMDIARVRFSTDSLDSAPKFELKHSFGRSFVY